MTEVRHQAPSTVVQTKLDFDIWDVSEIFFYFYQGLQLQAHNRSPFKGLFLRKYEIT